MNKVDIKTVIDKDKLEKELLPKYNISFTELYEILDWINDNSIKVDVTDKENSES